MLEQALPGAELKQRASLDDRLMRIGLGLLALLLIGGLVFPLYMLLSKSFQAKGEFIGLANYVRYFATPSLSISLWNSLFIAFVSTSITVSAAFLYAYGLTRTCMPGKAIFRVLAQVPLLAPSLLAGISLVYLFGNQGMLKSWLFGESIYGPIGIVMGEFFWTFPHALIILITAMSVADARLYEAAESLRASRTRIFFTVTLPGIKYGLISAFFVVFTLVITDFGVPKVIGGNYNVLATDVYKQVIGQQNFEMGAVVGMVLLAPALLAFAVDRLMQRKQVALLSARSVPYEPKPARLRDGLFFAFCFLLCAALLTILLTAAVASLIKLWPYNMSLSFKHYDFEEVDAAGWTPYWNTLRLALGTAIVGTIVVFCGAYLVEKSRGAHLLRGAIQLMCFIPLAVPGLVLGLSYIFFFNHPANPLNFLYGTMAILIVNTIAHFYTVGHLTAVTALKQMDPEFEAVSQSLKVPFHRTFFRVTVPVCVPTLLDISIYLFINAMTTVSAIIFLYAPSTQPASIAVLTMDDAGSVASAAAMAMMIVYTAATIRILHAVMSRTLIARTQAWRKR